MDQNDAEQGLALATIRAWLKDPGARQFLTMGGFAGTGKTYTIATLAAELDIPVAFCAPTGKAAEQLRRKMGGTVHTIHGLFYLPTDWHICGCNSCPDGKGKNTYGELVPPDQCPYPQRNHRGAEITVVTYVLSPAWERSDDIEPPGLVIADEASMINEQVWADMLSTGVRILAVGDHGQLLPVKSSFSLMKAPDLRLETIRRQEAGDPIIAMSFQARTQGFIQGGLWGENARRVPWSHAAATPWLQWQPGTLIIAARRATVGFLNEATRTGMLGSARPPTLVPGEPVICLQNDKLLGIFNGQMFTTREVGEDRDDPRHVITFTDTEGGWHRAALFQFGDLDALQPRERPRRCGLFTWAYALTCHKVQGSEADRVIVYEEDWPRNRNERARWLYTAVTRAKRELTVVHRG